MKNSVLCPLCGAQINWTRRPGTDFGQANCQDGRLVSRRLRADGSKPKAGSTDACLWKGSKIFIGLDAENETRVTYVMPVSLAVFPPLEF